MGRMMSSNIFFLIFYLEDLKNHRIIDCITTLSPLDTTWWYGIIALHLYHVLWNICVFSYLHNTNVVTLTHWVWWLVVPERLHWPPSAWWWHVTVVPRPFSRSHQSCWTEGPGWQCTHGRPRCIPTTDHITSTMSAHVGHVLPDNFFLLYRNKCLEYQCLRHDNTF